MEGEVPAAGREGGDAENVLRAIDCVDEEGGDIGVDGRECDGGRWGWGGDGADVVGPREVDVPLGWEGGVVMGP